MSRRRVPAGVALAALLSFLLVSLLPRVSEAQSHPKGMIGLGLSDVPGVVGAVVGVVSPGGPADRAGVMIKDAIVDLNGTKIPNTAALTQAIQAMSPGQSARLGIVRGSGSASAMLTLSVTVGPPDAAAQSAAPSRQDSTAATGQPLRVSGYTPFTDPLEQSFTIDMPAGWHTVGGMARRSALQINAFVRSLSPDRMTYLIIGEPTLLSYAPPSQMRNTIGYREGKLFDSGLGGISLVLRYLPGDAFARVYGENALSGLCPGLRFVDSRERADMAQNADKLVPAVAPSVSTGGEARFSCRHNGQDMEARVEAVTRATRDNIMWNVIFLKGFIARAAEAEKAEEILSHVGASFSFNPTWLERQSNLDQQAALAINRRMQEFFREEAGVIRNLNSVDENFSSMDEIVSGYSTYHDAATGSDYKLSNTNPFKWSDNTGRIFSTPTNTPPPWGGNLTPLARVAE